MKGFVWKDSDSSWWLVEVPFLNLMTQGRTRKEALEMMKDATLELLRDVYEEQLGEHFEILTQNVIDGAFELSCPNNELLFALGRRRKNLVS